MTEEELDNIIIDSNINYVTKIVGSSRYPLGVSYECNNCTKRYLEYRRDAAEYFTPEKVFELIHY